mgnify:CR=1 FL=1
MMMKKQTPQVRIPLEDDDPKYRWDQTKIRSKHPKVTIEKVVLVLLSVALILTVLLYCYHQLVVIASVDDDHDHLEDHKDVDVKGHNKPRSSGLDGNEDEEEAMYSNMISTINSILVRNGSSFEATDSSDRGSSVDDPRFVTSKTTRTY